MKYFVITEVEAFGTTGDLAAALQRGFDNGAAGNFEIIKTTAPSYVVAFERESGDDEEYVRRLAELDSTDARIAAMKQLGMELRRGDAGDLALPVIEMLLAGQGRCVDFGNGAIQSMEHTTKPSKESLADREFENYQLGDGITVVGHDRWNTDDPLDFTKIAYIEADDQPAEADSEKVSFHVRFNSNGEVTVAYALDMRTGGDIGARAGNEVFCAAAAQSPKEGDQTVGEFTPTTVPLIKDNAKDMMVNIRECHHPKLEAIITETTKRGLLPCDLTGVATSEVVSTGTTSEEAFEPGQQFESVKHAVALIKKQLEPMDALKAVIGAMIDREEFGIAAELVSSF